MVQNLSLILNILYVKNVILVGVNILILLIKKNFAMYVEKILNLLWKNQSVILATKKQDRAVNSKTQGEVALSPIGKPHITGGYKATGLAGPSPKSPSATSYICKT